MSCIERGEVYSILEVGENRENLPSPSLLFLGMIQVYAHAGATLDGKMYVTCGRRAEDYLKELHRYDPEADHWDTLADGPARRAWHGMAALLGKLYVIGGSNNDSGYRRDVHEVNYCAGLFPAHMHNFCILPVYLTAVQLSGLQ